MPFSLDPLVFGFLVALGIGLLIGIDRERKKGEGPTRGAAGLRTFTLASLAGATGVAVGGEILLAAVALGVTGFASLSYWHAHDTDPGLTTEIAPRIDNAAGRIRNPRTCLCCGRGRRYGRPPQCPHRAAPFRQVGSDGEKKSATFWFSPARP